jgi:hypothetical protein
MPDPLRLAAAAIEFGISHYGGREPARSSTPFVLKIVGVVCATAAAGFAVAALLIYLIPMVGAAGAAVAVSGALVAAAAITAGVSQYLSRPSRKRELARGPDRGPDLHALVADAEGFVRENKALVLAAAFVAGLLTAEEGSRTRDR